MRGRTPQVNTEHDRTFLHCFLHRSLRHFTHRFLRYFHCCFLHYFHHCFLHCFQFGVTLSAARCAWRDAHAGQSKVSMAVPAVRSLGTACGLPADAGFRRAPPCTWRCSRAAILGRVGPSPRGASGGQRWEGAERHSRSLCLRLGGGGPASKKRPVCRCLRQIRTWVGQRQPWGPLFLAGAFGPRGEGVCAYGALPPRGFSCDVPCGARGDLTPRCHARAALLVGLATAQVLSGGMACRPQHRPILGGQFPVLMARAVPEGGYMGFCRDKGDSRAAFVMMKRRSLTAARTRVLGRGFSAHGRGGLVSRARTLESMTDGTAQVAQDAPPSAPAALRSILTVGDLGFSGPWFLSSIRHLNIWALRRKAPDFWRSRGYDPSPRPVSSACTLRYPWRDQNAEVRPAFAFRGLSSVARGETRPLRSTRPPNSGVNPHAALER